MTKEELWELFPIFLVAHDNRWENWYNEIEKTLKSVGTYVKSNIVLFYLFVAHYHAGAVNDRFIGRLVANFPCKS